MNKRKALTLLLSLAILLSLALPAATARADDGGISEDNGDINEVGTEIEDLIVNKTAVYNEKTGRYTITLEAYATGASTYITQDIPTDFILVLDQSGSMAYDIGQVQYTAYTGNNTQNNRNYEKRHNGGSSNLWHKLEDGSYVSVSVTKPTSYNELSANLPNYSWNGECYWNYANNLYEKVGEEYKKVTVDYSWDYGNDTYTYTFSSDGSKIQSNGDNDIPDFGNRGPLYTPAADGNDTVYTYTYTDSAGAVQVIGTSTGASTRFTPAFYQRSTTTSGGGSRLNALKNAANVFATAVAAKAAGADGDISTTGDNIDHRIAVVGYADTDSDYGYNTGVFIGSTLNRYETAAAGVYGTALQDMSTTEGKDNVAASINALQASGATRTDYGLTMANGILNANPVPEGKTRNRIVIVFTDGSPTDFSGFEKNVANSAISTANAIKAGGTTVYSIGIFSGADASSAGTEPSGDLNNNSAQLTAACNRFMQQVSSNNGTPRSSSYYLSASDAGTLNSIFRQISQQIPTGGSNTELSGTATVKDIVSQYFKLPDNADENSITLETYQYHGPDASPEWTKNADAMGASATVKEKEVSVTGFDFAQNWCGTQTDAEGNNTIHEGNKLVIRFDVTPEPGFLGGNDVPTNNTSAGIYKKGETEPSKTFPVPYVNVPVKDVTVTATDKNVYLLGGVTLAELQKGATVTVGDIKLDLSKANDPDKPYGLEKWQTEYVDINVAVKNGDTDVTDKIESLTDDTTYTIEVTVDPGPGTTTPEKGPAATAKTGNDTGNIYVFKPELTFVDSVAYYGDTLPQPLYADNMNGMVWKHGAMSSTDEGVVMTGEAPNLGLTYTAGAGIKDGVIDTKQDIPVKVDVTINGESVINYTTFKHECGMDGCTWTEPTAKGNPAFLIHIKTCTLTITKAGNVANEPFVFTVSKDGAKYTEVTIVGADSVTIAELPVGTYSITEDTGWSWRYTPSYSNNGQAELTATAPTGTITCTNTKDNDQWLNDYNVISNIYGKSNTPTTDGNN